MWQLLVGAAVAGSTGLLAKHLLNPNPTSQNPQSSDLDQQKQDILLQNGASEYTSEEKGRKYGIFRFSSAGSDGKAEVKVKGKILRKKVVLNKSEESSSSAGVAEVSGRKFAVCLKKRRTAKNVAYKCGSCSSKDSFMFMISAGKSEINKLNSAMSETAKVVRELKTELCRRKSSCNLQGSNSANEVAKRLNKFSSKNMHVPDDKSGIGKKDHNDIRICNLSITDDAECASSVLTEEQEAEVDMVEMDQLEAELESELQKLSETEVSAKSLQDPVEQRFDSYQCQGVLPSELDQKLCHLLIEQQENQIEDLESELSLAQTKLREKEAELQALKDCVRRLTNFSLSAVSDDDKEAQGMQQECMNDQDCAIQSGSETRRSLVGMKRPIES